jgi:hypothetical protein
VILKKAREIFLKTFPNCEEKNEWDVLIYKEGKMY